MKQKHPPKINRFLTIRIAVLTLGMWLAAMILLTLAVASDMDNQMKRELEGYLHSDRRRVTRADTDLPGTVDVEMIESLGYPFFAVDIDPVRPFFWHQELAQSVGNDDWLWEHWDVFYGLEPAVIYYGENNEILVKTGDYLTFLYTTEENWKEENTEALGYGYVALEQIPGGPEAFVNYLDENPMGALSMHMFVPLLRLRGHFEDNCFHPVSIERGDSFDIGGRVDEIERLSRLDAGGHVQWEPILTVELEKTGDLQTIYAWDAGGFAITPKPVSVNGMPFDSLADLLQSSLDRTDSCQRDSLWDSVQICRRRYEDAYGIYTLAVAVRYYPIQYAFLRLMPTYQITLLAIAVILWRILRRLRQNLIRPLETMAVAAATGSMVKPASGWLEVRAVEDYLCESRKTIAQNKTDIEQLRTALDYAHNAEENRKQLISNITHELKTPLAIIHSYTECLQEDIAEEKRDHYLSVIREETERMDEMVLQMLDLSRLEAGKVRLAADSFSVYALTCQILERFAPLLEGKQQTVHFQVAEDFLITADESRIGQVITNLISNAHKYSAQGAAIGIKIYFKINSLYFRIENPAPHLSNEALEKVWDSFYRADASRNTPGTGLGLALVKTVIQLHGGTCTVRNIFIDQDIPSVEFGFNLPLA